MLLLSEALTVFVFLFVFLYYFFVFVFVFEVISFKAGSRALSFIVLLLSEALTVSPPECCSLLSVASYQIPFLPWTIVFVSTVFLPGNAICICPSSQPVQALFSWVICH